MAPRRRLHREAKVVCRVFRAFMKPSIIVWDLETVPDISGFAAANDLVGKSDAEIREAIGDKFPKHIYHSIVCIGALIAHWEQDHWAVDAVGAPHVGERTEKELITAFCDKIAELHQIGAKLLIGFDIIDWPIGIVSQ
jgi:predicted PolB exonuclease-like 3'-5' exonuclease